MVVIIIVFFVKQKTADEMRISDWSSDVCSSDLSPWRRIYLDLPGRGRTRGEPWITTNDQVLDIVLEVIETVIPGERFVIAGHSAGGYLARAVLHRRKIGRASCRERVCQYV